MSVRTDCLTIALFSSGAADRSRNRRGINLCTYSPLRRTLLLLATVLTLTNSHHAMAVPYASGVSQDNGTVSYILNEDADTVTIKRAGQADEVLNNVTRGAQSFALNGASSFEIEVSNSAPAGYTQISNDTDLGSAFFSPRGVAINRNPNSPHFGNIYVSEAAGGEVTKGEVLIRDTLEGLFVMGADQSDIIGQGADGRIGNLNTEGSSSTPFKITVAPDDSIYIADWSDGNSGVYRAPADLDDSSDWPNVLANDNRDGDGLTDNHGSIPAVWVEGTGASTVLYTMDEDWPDGSADVPEGRGDIFRYDIGTSTNFTGAPIVQVADDSTGPGGSPSTLGVIRNGLMDFVRDEDGTWWVSQFRSDDEKTIPALSRWEDGATEPIFVSGKNPRTPGDFDFDADVDGDDFLTWQQNNDTAGNEFDGDANNDDIVDGTDLGIWTTNYGDLQPADIVLDAGFGTLDIHNELDLIALGTTFGRGVYLIDISDPTAPALVDTIPQTSITRDVAFDVAGNVYVVSNITETLRIWSPGGDTVAVTGSDGSFVLNPAGVATVPEPGTFVLGLLFLAGGSIFRQNRD